MLPKMEYLWPEEKLRELHKKFLIILLVGVPTTPVIFAFFWPTSLENKIALVVACLVIDYPVALTNYFSLNKPNQGIRFTITIIFSALTSATFMALSGGFKSPGAFVPFVLVLMGGIFIGPTAGLIVTFAAGVFLTFVFFYLMNSSPYPALLSDFIFYMTTFLIVLLILHGIGKELSLQFEAKKKLEQVDDLKNQFIALASHYLRTPLEIIKNYANDLKKAQLEGIFQKDLAGIEVEEKELEILTEKLLTISQIERGQIKLLKLPADLNDLLKTVISEFKPKADQNRISLTYFEAAEPIKISLDRSRILEVFSHLIDNAIKFNKDGGSVVVTLTKKDQIVEIMVADTGVGIDKNQLEVLFTTFNKGGFDKTLQLDKPGAGLSLYLSKLIIEAHLGTISVQSEKDKGTIFTVSLPL